MGISVNHVCALFEGGAGIAARRLHQALLDLPFRSRMIVSRGTPSNNVEIYSPHKGLRRTAERELARHIRKRTTDQVDGLASFGFVRSGLANHLNCKTEQIVNLHWVNFDMISIAEIGQLRQPVVWTLHDMWPFCGAEHYTESLRWRDGYADRVGGALRDVNAWVWRRKSQQWRHPFQIVTPSRWLADCVRQSALMREWPVRVIPNAINTETWTPMTHTAARQAVGVPPDVPLVLFGAMGGKSDPRKGFNHLREALLRLHAEGRQLHLLVFGGSEPETNLPFPVHIAGAVHGVEALRPIYAAADVFALPSLQDNLPNTGIEALACGTPVVGFDIGGMPDLVGGLEVGELARPFDAADFARALADVLDRQTRDPNRQTSEGTTMSRAARGRVERVFAAPVVAQKYRDLYEEIWAGR